MASESKMGCRRARALAADYVDGELDAGSAMELESHLAECPRCPPLMAALTGVLAELRGLPELAATEEWVQATVSRTRGRVSGMGLKD